MSTGKLQKNVIKKEVGRRIAQVRNNKGETQNIFAEKFYIKRKNVDISEIETGKQAPDLTFLRDLRVKYGVDLNWILTGLESASLSPELNKLMGDEDMEFAIKKMNKIFRSQKAKRLVLRFLEDFETFMNDEIETDVEKKDFPNQGPEGKT